MDEEVSSVSEDEFSRMFERIRREIDRAFRELEETIWGEERPMFDLTRRCLEPLAHVREEEDRIIVTVDLPYVRRKEDINVSVSGNNLVIEAKMRRSVQYSTLAGVYRDLSFDTYRKVIKLPENVEPSKAVARFKRGILEVVIPKKVKKFRVRVE